MKIGIVGLGQMGKPIAANLLKAHGTLTVVVRSEVVRAEFERLGAVAAVDPIVLNEADVIFTCLPDAKAIECVLFESGLADTVRPGGIVVDLSTIGYAQTLSIAERLSDRGIHFLDSPVSGMASRAEQGTLTVMCGGDREAFDIVSAIFPTFSNKVLYMGKAGNGQLAKLINQLLFDINAAALAEILPLSAKLGLDPDRVGEIVNSGTGRSFASEFFIPRVLAGDFSHGYPMAAAYKDLVVCAQVASELCIPLPVTAAATASYQMALLRGHGAGDKGAMIKSFEELLDVTFRSPAIGLTASANGASDEA